MATAAESHGAHRADLRVRSLDDLLRLDHASLEELYRSATAPRIEDLRGDLRGRMLISPLANAAVADAMRSLSKVSWFPWKGKTFAPRDLHEGEGWNRVFTDRNLWFRFTTFVGRSRAGDFDALQLDYDHPENPFFIRAIKDEVRTVAPGLFLGQAWIVVSGTARFALWFALQSP